MYDSPQYDMGYDVSNYEGVYPPYGSEKARYPFLSIRGS